MRGYAKFPARFRYRRIPTRVQGDWAFCDPAFSGTRPPPQSSPSPLRPNGHTASPHKPTGGQPTEAWMCQYRRWSLQGTWRWRKTCIQPRPGSWMLPMYWRHSPLVGCAITGSGKWLQARSHSGSSRSSQPEHVACSCFKVGGPMVPLYSEQPIRRSVLFHPLYCVVAPIVSIESSRPITHPNTIDPAAACLHSLPSK